jgi:hypothetical protein
MFGNIILDIILAVSGALALIGLGAVAVYVTRGGRRHEVRITVEQDHRPPQRVTLSPDSAVVRELTSVEGIQLSVSDAASNTQTNAASRKRRPLEIAGLLTGAAAGLAIALPFVSSNGFAIGLAIGVAVGALLLTSAGSIAARLTEEFTRREWKDSSTRVQAEAIRDAALLRDHPHSSTPSSAA